MTPPLPYLWLLPCPRAPCRSLVELISQLEYGPQRPKMFLAVIWFPITVNVSLTKVPGLKTVMVLGEQLHLNSLGGRGMKRETRKHVVSSLTIRPYLLELQLFSCKVPKPCDRESSIPAIEGHDQTLSPPTNLWFCSGKVDLCGRKGHLGRWNNFTWGATQGKVNLWSQGSGFESLVTDAGPCTVEERDWTIGRQGVHRTERLYPQAQRKEQRNKA